MGLIKRIYYEMVHEHLRSDHEMVFLIGPRQVGKTTVGKEILKLFDHSLYLNWDIPDDKLRIHEGPRALMRQFQGQRLSSSKPCIMFDEIHKYRNWQSWIKGFYDLYQHDAHIIVTGSSRLDVYKVGGDSLMGRYFHYHVHPLSVKELIDPTPHDNLISSPRQIDSQSFEKLIAYGGFPRPFEKGEKPFHLQWSALRRQQLFNQEIRDLTNIQEIAQIELLALLLSKQIGQHTSYANLARKIQVTAVTVKRWLTTLQSFYYCFSLKPWSKNITRSLIKEPKYYLWDWSQVQSQGARVENFIACHLLKAVQYWNDSGIGDFDLFFLKDKQGREVDFIITREEKPWILIEVKNSSNQGISPSLYYFQKATDAQYAFQVSLHDKYIDKDCFSVNQPVIVPAKTFLSQLI